MDLMETAFPAETAVVRTVTCSSPDRPDVASLSMGQPASGPGASVAQPGTSQGSTVPSATSPAKPASPRPIRILVAEDNTVNQKVVLCQLGKIGYGADVVANGRQVLESLARQEYDLIFMDCHMPDMDGYEASGQIRAGVGGQPQVRIVALTANAMQGDRERCLEAGMDDYVAKPVRIEDLKGALERFANAKPRSAPQVADSKASEGPANWTTVPTVHLDAAKICDIRALGMEGEEDPLVEFACIFLDDAPQRLDALKLHASRGDRAAVVRTAGSLKASCEAIGAQYLAHLVRCVEELAARGSLDALPPFLERINEEFDLVNELLGEETARTLGRC